MLRKIVKYTTLVRDESQSGQENAFVTGIKMDGCCSLILNSQQLSRGIKLPMLRAVK